LKNGKLKIENLKKLTSEKSEKNGKLKIENIKKLKH